MNKKSQQLGMNASTANHRLVKDILWSLILETKKNKCCKCHEQMTRENFSIEHLVPWLDSEDPLGLYFDLDNIGFSHLKCNISSARKVKSECGTFSKYTSGCRCRLCKDANTANSKKHYSSEKRRERYIRNEKK